jgi:hypothetical protein
MNNCVIRQVRWIEVAVVHAMRAPVRARSRAGNEVAVVHPLDARVAQIAGRQHGVVAWGQLRAARLSRSAIEHRVKQGRLHPVHRGVYLVGHRVPPPLAAETAAVLALGPQAVLSHRSAASFATAARPRAPDPPLPRRSPFTTVAARRHGSPRHDAGDLRTHPSPRPAAHHAAAHPRRPRDHRNPARARPGRRRSRGPAARPARRRGDGDEECARPLRRDRAPHDVSAPYGIRPVRAMRA